MCCLHLQWKFLFWNWFVGFYIYSFFYFKESDWGASWTAHNETAGRNNVTIRDNPTTSNLTDTQRTHVTLGIATPNCLKTQVFWNCRWSDVRISTAKSVSTPWGKTYIHETYKSHRLTVCVLVWLYKTVLLRAASPANMACALQPPCPTGMECLETSLLRYNLTYS